MSPLFPEVYMRETKNMILSCTNNVEYPGNKLFRRFYTYCTSFATLMWHLSLSYIIRCGGVVLITQEQFKGQVL